jgi:hypothetical protein
MVAGISSGFSMLSFQQRQLYNQNISKQRYAYNGKYDIFDQVSQSVILYYCSGNLIPFSTCSSTALAPG